MKRLVLLGAVISALVALFPIQNSVMPIEAAPKAVTQQALPIPFESSYCVPSGKEKKDSLYQADQGRIYQDPSVVADLSQLGGPCETIFTSIRTFKLNSEYGDISLDGQKITNGKGLKLTGKKLVIIYKPNEANGFDLVIETYTMLIPSMGSPNFEPPQIPGIDVKGGCKLNGIVRVFRLKNPLQKIIDMPWYEEAKEVNKFHPITCALETNLEGDLYLRKKLETGPGFKWHQSYAVNELDLPISWLGFVGLFDILPPLEIPQGWPAAGECRFDNTIATLFYDHGTQTLYVPSPFWADDVRKANETKEIFCRMRTDAVGTLYALGKEIPTGPGFTWSYYFPPKDPSLFFSWKKVG